MSKISVSERYLKEVSEGSTQGALAQMCIFPIIAC